MGCFVIKFTNAGALTWARSFGGPNLDQAFTLFSDASSNINISGYFAGTVDFNPSATTNNLVTPTGITAMFSLKLNSAGNYVSAFAPQAYASNSATQ